MNEVIVKKDFFDVHEKVNRKKGEKFKASDSRIIALKKSDVISVSRTKNGEPNTEDK